MERVLTDVDPDRADGFQCILRCAHRVLIGLALRLPTRLSS
jgi:hypothetical protein